MREGGAGGEGGCCFRAFLSPSFLALPAIVCRARPGDGEKGAGWWSRCFVVFFSFPFPRCRCARKGSSRARSRCVQELGSRGGLCSQRSRNVPGQPPARGEGVEKLRCAGNRCLDVTVRDDALKPGNTKICVRAVFRLCKYSRNSILAAGPLALPVSP